MLGCHATTKILETYFSIKQLRKTAQNLLPVNAYAFPRMRCCLLAFGLVKIGKMHKTKLQFLALWCSKKHQQYSDRHEKVMKKPLVRYPAVYVCKNCILYLYVHEDKEKNYK
jgi:hypothetical protein